MNTAIVHLQNSNIYDLRKRYPLGLHFVVGDTHGEWKTLEALMDKIAFDPQKDHVYFVGDYNEGGNVHQLMNYISKYYQEDYSQPGFHLIRGNHERSELWPTYPLANMPDIIVLPMNQMTYYIVHAGMISNVFDFINEDMEAQPGKDVYVYGLGDESVCYNAPFRQIIWSMRGLYSQNSHWRRWPSEEKLLEKHACIIHGHTPYCFFMKQPEMLDYGERNVFWKEHHMCFSESLQSFDVDSNMKGVYRNGEAYRGLACVCLEVLEEAAEKNERHLTVESMRESENIVFSVPYCSCWGLETVGDISKLLHAKPKMKTITFVENEQRRRIPIFKV